MCNGGYACSWLPVTHGRPFSPAPWPFPPCLDVLYLECLAVCERCLGAAKQCVQRSEGEAQGGAAGPPAYARLQCQDGLGGGEGVQH